MFLLIQSAKQNGISDILIANEIVTEPKIKSLACLNRYASVIVCADNKDNIDDLDHWAGYFGVKIPVLVELNIALDRCGARNADEVLELAKHVMNKNNLDLKGIQAYEGRYPDEICTGADMTAWTEKVTGHVAEVRKYLEDAGITCDIVSGIGTSTLTHAVKIPDALTEVQTGSYVFMESAYDIEKVGLSLEQSLFIMTKVCSIHGDRIILAAGEKSITNDQGMPVIKDDPDAQFEMNEEHILLDKTEKLKDLKIGDTVLIIPSHCCTTVNLHDYLFGVRNGIVESVWPVTARGCSF